MNLSDVQRDIELYFSQNWDETPVVYQNVPYESTEEFVRLTILNDDRYQASMGCTNNVYRMLGMVIVQIFSSKNIGTKRSLFLADIVISLFQSKVITNIKFKTPSVIYQGITNIYYQLNIGCPYYIDAIQ